MDLTSKTRLLYAEDDPDTRDMISVALGSEGFEVVCPTDLRDFLKIAGDQRWDLFVLDNWMPEISGVELCRRIKEFDSTTPIVFYSAVAYEHDKNEALAAGASAYIVKPIALDDLILALRAVVASSQIS
jgi:DNA-binding response OmpR family regulator